MNMPLMFAEAGGRIRLGNEHIVCCKVGLTDDGEESRNSET